MRDMAIKKQHILIQIFKYKYLMFPDDLLVDNSEDENETYKFPTPLTTEQLDYLQKNFDDQSNEYDLFIKLCPYLNGKFYLEELSYFQVNVQEDEDLLKRVFIKFKSLIVTVEHEEFDWCSK